jgi:hypothetical protein
MKRRQSLLTPFLRSLVVLIPLLGAAVPSSAAQGEAPAKGPVIVVNRAYRLLLDSQRGTIFSWRATFGVDRELLIPGHAGLPLFKIEFLNDGSEFRTVTSSEAKEVRVHQGGRPEEPVITLEYKELGGLPVDARATIRCPAGETLTYWSLEVNNRTTSWIGHIQFPVIKVPFDSPTSRDSSHILWSFADGALSGPVLPSMSVGGWGGRRYDAPEVWRYNNYPGEWSSAQLLAYYNDAGGLYLACDDARGLPKFIDPLMDKDGVMMGIGHYPGTRGPGVTTLPYHVVLGTFHGDWYAAAEIYRQWAVRQPFCRTKLAERSDVPKWLAESPLGIAFPMRGQGDWDPPAAVNPDYTPLTNALPYLDKLAVAIEGPLMPIIFNWERGGPWVQPEAFPPLGGEAAVKEFMAKAKAKGWHPVIYGDGLCWVTAQKNTGYDGMPYFRAHGGEAAAVLKWDGTLLENMGFNWRKNYAACVGTEAGRRMILGMTRGMVELGPEVVQQFDQGPGPLACYAKGHGHPPVPGPWMTESFNSLVKSDLEVARSVNPHIVMSCEGAPPESYLQDFQIWDARVTLCPLYSFLYHEYGNGFEGFYTNRVNDEALRLSAARALVNGYLVDFTLREKGRIEYDWDQTWTRAVPDQAAILDWAKRINHFRAGVARDYLVFGRMLRPWTVSGVAERDFGWGREPVVQSATWQAQDGRIGVVLANYGDLPASPRLELEGQGNRKLLIVLDDQHESREVQLPSVVDLSMPPRSLCLLELE